MNGRRHSQVILSCSCWTSGMLAVGSLEIIQVWLGGGWSLVQQVFCVKSLPQKHSSLPPAPDNQITSSQNPQSTRPPAKSQFSETNKF